MLKEPGSIPGKGIFLSVRNWSVKRPYYVPSPPLEPTTMTMTMTRPALADHDLLHCFGSRLPSELADALLVKFRAAETRNGCRLPLGYANRMLFHFLIDQERAKEAAPRVAARALLAKARELEEERRIATFVRTEEEFKHLLASDVVRTFTFKQMETLSMMRQIAIDGDTGPEVAARFCLGANALQARFSRMRKLLRPHLTALGLTALKEVFLDSRVHAQGGTGGFR